MIGRLHMNGRRAGALVLAAGLLAAGCSVALSAIQRASALEATTLLPSQLQALEQKMERLQVNSERFSRVTRGFVLGSQNHVWRLGEPDRLVRIPVHTSELGEASVSPAEGVVFTAGKRNPRLIAIGSTLYEYAEPGKRSHNHRPWVRSRSRESPATRMLPFMGGGSLEVDAGGTGSFGHLINLLTTRVGPVSVDGPVSVQGKQTTEFTATVEPRLLIKHITVEDVAGFKKEWPIETLQIFLTETGLPIRVVEAIRSQYLNTTTTTEIPAVNIPVNVKPPPARNTIAPALVRPSRSK
jgi:hypothetical protein